MANQMIMKHGDSWPPPVLGSHDVDQTATLVTVTMSSYDSVLLADYASILDSEGLRVHELEGASGPRRAHWRPNVVFAGTTYEWATVRRISKPRIVNLGLPA